MTDIKIASHPNWRSKKDRLKCKLCATVCVCCSNMHNLSFVNLSKIHYYEVSKKMTYIKIASLPNWRSKKDRLKCKLCATVYVCVAQTCITSVLQIFQKFTIMRFQKKRHITKLLIFPIEGVKKISSNANCVPLCLCCSNIHTLSLVNFRKIH